jgi:tRNA pseudouridine55 synthase
MSGISGVLNIDKPGGITSHDVVSRIRKITGQRKVGHTGTLDPMATGVLVVCIGQATRLIEYMVPGKKKYRAKVRFGVATNTYDADGEPVSRQDVSGLTPAHLRAVLPGFAGQIEQYPPIFSAIKQGGRPLYKAARAGQQPTVDPRLITIYDLDWVEWVPPDLTIDVVCSPGTYIRSLAHDLGKSVGAGAHLAGLIRTANGPFLLEDAVSLSDLAETDWQPYLKSLDTGVSHLPAVTLDTTQSTDVQQGRQIHLTDPNLLACPVIRAYSDKSHFLAVLLNADNEENLWQPKKVFQV